MVRTLHHRGPDDEGSVTLPGVGLGMRRLAIVDLAAGQQPIGNETGSDPARRQRRDLQLPRAARRSSQGSATPFRSRSDIEVLVHAYEEWGEALPDAVCAACSRWRCGTAARARCWRRATGRARSRSTGRRRRAGCCWHRRSRRCWCGPRCRATLDLEALDQFLTYEYVLTPRTILAGVHKLPAGHLPALPRRRGDGASLLGPGSDRGAAVDGRRGGRGAARGAAAARSASQMMADVPLGAFLSGGIDSSSIVALHERGVAAAGQHLQHGLRGRLATTSCRTRARSRSCSAPNHRERTGHARPRCSCSTGSIVHLDEPFADVSLFPTYLVSQLAREHVTVALSGDGGDELFGGYDAYEAQALAHALCRSRARRCCRRWPRSAPRCRRPRRRKASSTSSSASSAGAAQAPADLGHYRWMVLPQSARPSGGSTRRRCRRAADVSDVYAPVREVLARGGARRRAQPAALRRPVDVPRRRHPGEGRSHEHGDVAGDAGAVPRRRRDGAGVLDARPT